MHSTSGYEKRTAVIVDRFDSFILRGVELESIFATNIHVLNL